MVTEAETRHLRQCVDLAAEALAAGDAPFGSVLVEADGAVLAADRNRVSEGDPTAHPEFALARWAAQHLSLDRRATATVYTSGEHCPMCSAAHGWVGLGRIVYASSTPELTQWLDELGAAASPVRPLSIQQVAPHVTVDGPVPRFREEIRELHRRYQHGP